MPERDIGNALDELIDAIDDDMAGSGLTGSEGAASGQTARIGDAEQHILFSMAGGNYAFPIQYIIEVSRLPEVTFVPNVPGWVMV
ncbi:MAG: chemotaxis protein CheW [Myxococcota bacterium]